MAEVMCQRSFTAIFASRSRATGQVRDPTLGQNGPYLLVVHAAYGNRQHWSPREKLRWRIGRAIMKPTERDRFPCAVRALWSERPFQLLFEPRPTG
jgi:hypothetical protein